MKKNTMTATMNATTATMNDTTATADMNAVNEAMQNIAKEKRDAIATVLRNIRDCGSARAIPKRILSANGIVFDDYDSAVMQAYRAVGTVSELRIKGIQIQDMKAYDSAFVAAMKRCVKELGLFESDYMPVSSDFELVLSHFRTIKRGKKTEYNDGRESAYEGDAARRKDDVKGANQFRAIIEWILSYRIDALVITNNGTFETVCENKIRTLYERLTKALLENNRNAAKLEKQFEKKCDAENNETTIKYRNMYDEWKKYNVKQDEKPA